jgi:hypothetical protein
MYPRMLAVEGQVVPLAAHQPLFKTINVFDRLLASSFLEEYTSNVYNEINVRIYNLLLQ